MTKQLDLQDKIGPMVRTIVEDANRRHPHAMDELMHIHECSNDKTIHVAMTNDVSEPLRVIKTETAAFEALRASLGVIFGERYGWTEEAIDDMTLSDVFIALEHAMEYDAPSKKSVWNL
jgi:hypothetical protein